nr:NAD-dependent epimerase/dehydratase family protein [Anaerolineae bacterium]
MILIAGATGFVGRAVVRRLAAERREVRCLLRPSRREQRLPTGILFSTVSASMDDLPALRTAMQDVTAVVHLTWEEDFDQGGTLHSHAKDTANLVAAAQEADVPRFIYLSRLGADRASAYPLFRARGEAEAAVRESGLDYTILRVAVTYGPEDAFTNVLAMLAKAVPFVLPIPDVGMSCFQPLWIVDLVTCIVATLDRDDLIGQVIPLGGPEHFAFEQMVAQVLAAVGVRRRLMHVRMPLVRGVIRLFDALLPRNPTPPWWLDLLAVGSATELGTIPRHFGFEPARFAQCLEYLRRKRSWRRDLVRFVLHRR